MRGPEVFLEGAATPLAKVTDTALGSMRSIEHAIQGLNETASDVEKTIARTRKHLADLNTQTNQPFEYEDTLGALPHRQQEISDALDLTRNQASAQSETEADRLREEPDEDWL